MQYALEAYLDIETTGLSPKYSEITVVGIHLHNGIDAKFIQLLGGDVTADKILEALQGVNIIYTYNGSRFDLPFIYYRLGINLARLQFHYLLPWCLTGCLLAGCLSGGNFLRSGSSCLTRVFLRTPSPLGTQLTSGTLQKFRHLPSESHRK